MANIGKDGNQHDNISDDDAIAAYCLTLPGETLYLTPPACCKKSLEIEGIKMAQ